MNALLEELTWRGFVAQSTDVDALAAHLDAGPITSYVGFDPTAASLHIGHLMQLLVARRIQEAGHRPILLVGGATGLIGDPKLAGERVMNDAAVVHEWAERLRDQVSGYVSFQGDNAALVVNNFDWTSTLSTLDFLRDVGKHFPVNRMLARDVVARRLEDGISFTEFAYVLLQSLDYRELYRTHGATLQTGAQDQWGNITAGIDFIRRTEGVQVHGLVTPLLTKEWTSDVVPAGVLGSPVLSADGKTVYVTGRDRQLWALNAVDGKPKWSLALDFQPQTPPSVTPGGNLVVGGGPDTRLVGLKDAGDRAEVVWHRDDVSPLTTSSLAGGGAAYTVVAGDPEGLSLLVFNPADGHTLNSYPLPEADGFPVGVSVGNDRRVVAATSAGQVYSLAPAQS